MRFRPIIILCFAALFAPAAMAQTSVQDFTLPEPTPTQTPEVQGPADDTGIITRGPRVIPTDTPTPVPTPTQTPSVAQPTPAETQAPLPRPTSQPPVTRPAQSATPAPRPQETFTPPATPDATTTAVPPPALPTLPAETPSASEAAQPEDTANREAPVWMIALGAGLAFLAGLAGLFFWRRHRSAHHVPEIERPIVAGDAADPAATQPSRYDVQFQVESLTRSLMALTLTGHLEIRNRSDRAIRDLALGVELTTAHMLQQSGVNKGAVKALEELPAFERIGPHQSQSRKLNLRVAFADIAGARQNGVPVIVPLLQVRTSTTQGEDRWKRFAIGHPSAAGTGRLQPLALEGPPGGYDNVRARPLD